jgi:hypothetical protein
MACCCRPFSGLGGFNGYRMTAAQRQVLHRLHLIWCQMTIGAERKIADMQVTDPDPLELDDRMAGMVDHAAHLAFSAFVDRDLDPGVCLFLAKFLHPGRRGFPILQEYALFEVLDLTVLQHTLDLYVVCLRQFVAGVRDAKSEVPVVRQEQ